MSKDFSVKITDSGRCGYVNYKEKNGEFSFEWEYGADGMIIHVLSPIEWNLYCEKSYGKWATSRRDEVLKNIAEETLRQTSPNGSYEIIDDYGCIVIYFKDSRLVSFLSKIFGKG